MGKIAKKFYLEIPNHFKFIKLDKFTMMPSHTHGIIEINNRRNAPRRVPVNNELFVRTNMPITDINAKPRIGKNTPTVEQNAPWRVPTGIQPLVKNSLSSIINHFKGNVKRFCNKNDLEYFAWQSRFHDRIIRNNDELNRIRQYIINNPLKWEIDR
ncbi:MAG: transposase, partial [Patescibacteria group bacterium]|nr:transposase [Patescibacteria group bacterium]